MSRQPTPQDKFSFGLWTVGWTGTDPFGGPSRPALEPWAYVDKLAEIGAWGVTFHDNDVFPFDADEATKDQIVKRFRGATDRPAWSSRWSPPTPSATRSSRTAGSPPTTVRCAASALRKVLRAVDLAADLGASTFVHVGRSRGQRSTTVAKDVYAVHGRATRRASTPSPATSSRRATT